MADSAPARSPFWKKPNGIGQKSALFRCRAACWVAKTISAWTINGCNRAPHYERSLTYAKVSLAEEISQTNPETSAKVGGLNTGSARMSMFSEEINQLSSYSSFSQNCLFEKVSILGKD